MGKFKDYEHLLRVAGAFVVGIVLFGGLRALLVPKSFGEYGFYRGAALGELAARPVVFAGHQTCEACHDAEAALKHQGMHVTVNCEACHGPLQAHALDPTGSPAPHLDTAVLCVRCHAANAARPKSFPQIVVAEHNPGLPCETCHQPHSPLQGLAGAKP